MEPLISVIIPIYKVEKYLDQCIQSVLEQTYKNIEIVLVDDGSPDDCGRICDDYQKLDARVVVIHKQNEGVSAARNDGVKRARGQYIAFVDPDDYVFETYIEYLWGLLKKYDADISVGGRIQVDENENEIKIKILRQPDKEIVLKHADAVEAMCYGKILSFSPCCKLYKRELVEKHPFPVGRVYEDLAVLYKIADDASNVVIGTQNIYYYRQRQGSIRHTKVSEQELYGITAAKELMAYINLKYPALQQAGEYRYVKKLIEYLPVAIETDDITTINLLAKYEKGYLLRFLKNKNAPFKSKVAAVILAFGGKKTKILWNLAYQFA